MKSNAVFYIDEERIKFLQVLTSSKLVTALDVLLIKGQSEAQISQGLWTFLKRRRLNLNEARVTVVIPRSRVILRLMSVPSHQDSEIRSMIELQVSSSIPYELEEVQMDFQVLAKSPDGYAKVAVVIIPQETAMRYWKIFAEAKVRVHSITLSSIGLWNLYTQWPNTGDKPAAVFDLDLDKSEICVCHPAHWSASRELPSGLTQIAQDGYGEILKQWELTQHNIGGEKAAQALDTVYIISCWEGAFALGQELTKTQNALNIQDVLLTKFLKLARDVRIPSLCTQEGMSLAPLAGIALSSQTPPINLVPTAVRQSQEQKMHQRQLIICGLWLAAALAALGLSLSMGYVKKNIQLAKLKDQLRTTKEAAQKVEERLKKIHDIESMVKNRLVFSDLALEIYRVLPAQVYLVSMALNENNSLSFQGVASNPVDVNQFQKDLANYQKFSNVNLDYVNKRVTQQGEVDYFKITCAFKPMSAPHEKA